MKIAVIGAGRMGALRTEDLVKVGADVTVFNRNREGAKTLANEFNCHHDDLAHLKENIFDGYVVATATDSHIGLLADLIPLGKPILCEKPISLTVEETDSVIVDCKKCICMPTITGLQLWSSWKAAEVSIEIYMCMILISSDGSPRARFQKFTRPKRCANINNMKSTTMLTSR